MTGAVRELTGAEVDDWDAHAVDVEGGHVLQSRAWAAHRAGGGWRPRFLATDGARALALVRPWPLLGGGSAYLPRGPVAAAGAPWREDDRGSAETVGTALTDIAAWLADRGVDVIAADPEVAAGDAGYASRLREAGFRPIAEIQPSRHRLALPLPDDGDHASVFDGIAKTTRQRIRRAERDGLLIVRHDVRLPADPPAAGFTSPGEPAEDAFRRFYDLLHDTGERLGFGFGGVGEFVPWWCRALEAGHLVYLEAREGVGGDVLGGLVLYRHGRRLSTIHSADRADRRREHPGTMHLLRWRAIEIALSERRTEMDLGGADVAGARRPPEPGEPTYGLYEHKRSFGATWVELAGAQERVSRPWRYAAGRALARARRAAGR